MKTVEEHVKGLRGAPYFLDDYIATKFERQFEARWKLMRTDLHFAGALLNPFLVNVVELQNNGEAKWALNRVLLKMCELMELNFMDAVNKLTEFQERTGPFDPIDEAPDVTQGKMKPHQWWNLVGANVLPKIAKRILSQTCSASSCERNWSMYSFVHSKVRNRLATAKAEALVYIYSNSKFEHQKRGHNSALFYEKYLEDGDTAEENEEPLSSASSTDLVGSEVRRAENRRLARERVEGNLWAGLEGTPSSPVRRPWQRAYGNTFTANNDENNDDEDENERRPNIPEEEVVFPWNWDRDVASDVNISPRRANVTNDNVENMDPPVIVEPVVRIEAEVEEPIPRVNVRMETRVRRVLQGSEERQASLPVEDVARVSVTRQTTPLPHNDVVRGNVEYDSDVPLGRLLNCGGLAPLNGGGNSTIARATRLTPTPPSRPPRHHGPRQTFENKVYGSAPQPTPLSLRSGPGESSNPTRARGRGGKKRMRKTQERLQRNPKRKNSLVQRFVLGDANSTRGTGQSNRVIVGGHPTTNIDGTTDALRLTKRLVQTMGTGGVDTEVRNLNSEVEREVQVQEESTEDDDNQSSSANDSEEEADEETDPDADEAGASDHTFCL